jgi:ketol-acid reductoisomerase
MSPARRITAETKAEMKWVLADIQSGKFACDWCGEQGRSGQLQGHRVVGDAHPSRKYAKLRAMMP